MSARPAFRAAAGHGGAIVLITLHAVAAQVPLHASPRARPLARRLGAFATWSPHRCLAWVLLPARVHALVRLGRAEPAPALLRRLRGELGGCACWSPSCTLRPLAPDEDPRACARRLVAAPLREGLAPALLAYPYWDAVWLQVPRR